MYGIFRFRAMTTGFVRNTPDGCCRHDLAWMVLPTPRQISCDRATIGVYACLTYIQKVRLPFDCAVLAGRTPCHLRSMENRVLFRPSGRGAGLATTLSRPFWQPFILRLGYHAGHTGRSPPAGGGVGHSASSARWPNLRAQSAGNRIGRQVGLRPRVGVSTTVLHPPIGQSSASKCGEPYRSSGRSPPAGGGIDHSALSARLAIPPASKCGEPYRSSGRSPPAGGGIDHSASSAGWANLRPQSAGNRIGCQVGLRPRVGGCHKPASSARSPDDTQRTLNDIKTSVLARHTEIVHCHKDRDKQTSPISTIDGE